MFYASGVFGVSILEEKMLEWTTLSDFDLGYPDYTWNFSIAKNIGMTLTQDMRITLLATPGDEGYLRVTNSTQKLTGANFSIEDCSSPTLQTTLYHVLVDDKANVHTKKIGTTVTPRSQAVTFKVEAENMTLQSFGITVSQPFASNAKLITGTQPVDGTSLATATYTFAGQPGDYNIEVGYFDENDGQSVATLYKNNEVLMTWAWSEATTSGNASAATARTRQSGIFRFNPGDTIKYTVTRQAGENGRTDYFLFRAVEF